MKHTNLPLSPDIFLQTNVDLQDIEECSAKELKKHLQKTDGYDKYVAPAIMRRKLQKRNERNEWWWNKGVPIINTILALIAAITGIISLLLQLGQK